MFMSSKYDERGLGGGRREEDQRNSLNPSDRIKFSITKGISCHPVNVVGNISWVVTNAELFIEPL